MSEAQQTTVNAYQLAIDKLMYVILIDQRTNIIPAKQVISMKTDKRNKTVFHYYPVAEMLAELMWQSNGTNDLFRMADREILDYIDRLNANAPSLEIETISQKYITELALDVVEQFTRQRAIQMAKWLVQMGESIDPREVLRIINDVATENRRLLTNHNSGRSWKDATAVYLDRINSIRNGNEGKYFMPFLIGGDVYNPLDALLGGMERGGLVVIAAEAGVGKSRFVNEIIRQNARRIARHGLMGIHALAALEMPGEDYVASHVSADAMLDHLAMRRGEWTDEEFEAAENSAKISAHLPIEFFERSGASVSEMKSWLESLVDVYGSVHSLTVDFTRRADVDEFVRDETIRVNKIFKGLADLAKNFTNPDGTKIVVIAITELKRNVNPPYSEEDILYSGSYEAFTAMILIDPFKHELEKPFKDMINKVMPDYWQMDIPQRKMQRIIQVVKGRNTGTGWFCGLEYAGKFNHWRTMVGWESYYPNNDFTHLLERAKADNNS